MSQEQYKKWIATSAHLSGIDQWLGKSRDAENWLTINQYLPKSSSLPEFKNKKVVSKYNSSADGIDIRFPGFDQVLDKLAKQVVFREPESNNTRLVAELISGNEYDLADTILENNFKLKSWTVDRVMSQWDDKNHLAAQVAMDWEYIGTADGQTVETSTLLWKWLPYDP